MWEWRVSISSNFSKIEILCYTKYSTKVNFIRWNTFCTRQIFQKRLREIIFLLALISQFQLSSKYMRRGRLPLYIALIKSVIFHSVFKYAFLVNGSRLNIYVMLKYSIKIDYVSCNTLLWTIILENDKINFYYSCLNYIVPNLYSF